MPIITPVLLLSAQTLPNVLFLKELQNKGVQIKKIIFITTRQMLVGVQGIWILKAVGLEGKVELVEIEIAAEDYRQAKIDIQSYKHDANAFYYVNLTGGTKIMAMVAFDFYRAFADCRCFYMPIGGKVVQRVYPDNEVVSLTTELNLEEYLAAYGYEIERQGQLFKPFAETEKIFKKVLKATMPAEVPEIKTALEIEGPKGHHAYYMGAWLEEFIYYKIKQFFGLKNNQIAFNARLKLLQTNSTTDSDSEIDVLFVKDNKLFIFECKCYIKNNFSGDKIYAPMYKLGAIQKTLGLHASCFLTIANDLGQDAQRLKRIELLQKLLNVRTVLALENLKNFDDFLKGNIKMSFM